MSFKLHMSHLHKSYGSDRGARTVENDMNSAKGSRGIFTCISNIGRMASVLDAPANTNAKRKQRV